MNLPASWRTIGRGIMDWWDSWLDFEVMTLVWFFAQLTIILGPPATFGMYHVANKMLRDGEALGLKGMIQGARMYFGKALLWGLVNFLALLLGVVNLWFYYGQLDKVWGLAAEILVLLLVVFWLITQFYAVAFFMEQINQNVFLAIRNGFYLTMGSLFYTLMIMVVVVALVGLSVSFVIPIFLGAPALIVMLGTRALFDRLVVLGLKKADPDPKTVV